MLVIVYRRPVVHIFNGTYRLSRNVGKHLPTYWRKCFFFYFYPQGNCNLRLKHVISGGSKADQKLPTSEHRTIAAVNKCQLIR
jgi:hypothetical protein